MKVEPFQPNTIAALRDALTPSFSISHPATVDVSLDGVKAGLIVNKDPRVGLVVSNQPLPDKTALKFEVGEGRQVPDLVAIIRKDSSPDVYLSLGCLELSPDTASYVRGITRRDDGENSLQSLFVDENEEYLSLAAVVKSGRVPFSYIMTDHKSAEAAALAFLHGATHVKIRPGGVSHANNAGLSLQDIFPDIHG